MNTTPFERSDLSTGRIGDALRHPVLWIVAVILIAILSLVLGLIEGQASADAWAIIGLVALTDIILLGVVYWTILRRISGPAGNEVVIDAMESSPDGRLILAPDGRVVYCNAAFRWLCGGEAARSLSSLDLMAVGDEQALMDLARLRLDAQAGQMGRIEIPVRTAAGHREWRALSVHPLSSRPGYQMWVAEDITGRQMVREAQAQEIGVLADLLEEAPVGMFSTDPYGVFRYVNSTFAALTGYPQSELLSGRVRLHDLLPTTPPDGHPAHDPFAYAEGADRSRVRLRTRRGDVVETRIVQTVARDAAGRVSWTRSVVRQLTLRDDWEEALRRSEQRFQRIFEEAPVGIVEADARGIVTATNRAFRELAKPSRGRIVGQPLFAFIDRGDHQIVERQLAEVGRSQTAQTPVEVRLSGEHSPVAALYVSRNEGAGGTQSGFIFHLIDTTEQKKLEQQFAQSQKMQAIGQLAGGVAHDFNNLLTGIIGFAELLLLRYRPGEEAYGEIMQIKQSGLRARALVKQLLAFSRQQPLQPRVLQITDVLAELAHLLRRLIGENIELRIRHGQDLAMVKVDQGQLGQVIINLAVNARDAMPNGGLLSIETANVTLAHTTVRQAEEMPPGEYVQITVRDTGHGIPPGTIERIFEPFFSTKEVGQGTGLGLSTVYGIVKQTNGFIFVESRVGRGTAFTIFFPVHSDSAVAGEANWSEAGFEESGPLAAIPGSPAVLSLPTPGSQPRPIPQRPAAHHPPGDASSSRQNQKVNQGIPSPDARSETSANDTGPHAVTEAEAAQGSGEGAGPETPPQPTETDGARRTNRPAEPTAPQTDAAQAEMDGTRTVPVDLTGKGTILLVEDEDTVRLFGARALRSKGYKVLEASSGIGALDLIESGTTEIDLVITDVVMPMMGGPEFIQKARLTRPDLKVVFISGYAEDDFRERLGSGENIHFLPKPFSLKQLAGTVKTVIDG